MFQCAAIHKNIRVEGSNATGLRVIPCCVYETNNNYSTLSEYHASDEYQQLSTANDWPAGCNACKKQEQQNQTSYRQHANHALAEIKGRRFELFPSNICNLKCVMCGPASSSALAQEQRILGITDDRYTKEFDASDEVVAILEQADDIESISLIGGEFFLAKSNLRILELAIKRHLPVRVVTNATVILPGHLNMLQQLENLELQISCDGINTHYEFMRYPAKWNIFLANTKTLIASLPRAKINFHFVVQPLNVQNLIPSLAFLNTLKKPTRVTNLVQPEHVSWSILTDEERNRIISVMRSQLAEFKLTDRQRSSITDLIETICCVDYSEVQRRMFSNVVGRIMTHRGFDMVEVERFELPTNSV